MKKVKLNNGVEMPVLGYGVYQIEDLEECEECVYNALEIGYRLIDTAAVYQNEEAVGKAIERSDVDRNDIFLTSKLWVQNTGYESTKKAFEKSLERLKTDYLDLYLIHQPYGDIHGAWRAMEELYKEDQIRAIGISNFQPDRVMDLIIHNKVVPAVNQIETHPFCQQKEVNEFLEKQGIQHESWAPFAEGENNMFNNDLLNKIGKQYNKTAAQIILRWLIERDIVVIPKTVHKERMEENFNVFDFELSGEDRNRIAELDTGGNFLFSPRDPEMVKEIGSKRLDILEL